MVISLDQANVCGGHRQLDFPQRPPIERNAGIRHVQPECRRQFIAENAELVELCRVHEALIEQLASVLESPERLLVRQSTAHYEVHKRSKNGSSGLGCVS